MAFDANFMNYTALWYGKFISVNWNGQAPGNFNPLEKATSFNSGMPFSFEANLTKWQQPLPILKNEGDNPDPDFVIRNGYIFKGYEIKDDRVIFNYLFKEIVVKDTLLANSAKELKRELILTSKEAKIIHFKIANKNKLKALSETKYAIDENFEIETTIPAKLIDDALILTIPLKIGENTINLQYRSIK